MRAPTDLAIDHAASTHSNRFGVLDSSMGGLHGADDDADAYKPAGEAPTDEFDDYEDRARLEEEAAEAAAGLLSRETLEDVEYGQGESGPGVVRRVSGKGRLSGKNSKSAKCISMDSMGGEGGSAAGSMATEKLNRQLRESAAANPREQTQEELLALKQKHHVGWSTVGERDARTGDGAGGLARLFPRLLPSQWPSLEDHFATISEEGHITPGSSRTSENGLTSRNEEVGAQGDGQLG